MNKLHALMVLVLIGLAASVSASYSVFYADKHRAIGISYGYEGYAYPAAYPAYYDYGYPANYASTAAYDVYAPTPFTYDGYPANAAYLVGVPGYGYEFGSYGSRTVSTPRTNCGNLSLSDAEIVVPRGSASEATLTLRNRSGTSFQVNDVQVRDTLNTRAGKAVQSRSTIGNGKRGSISIPVSAAFDAQENLSALNVRVIGQSVTGKPCTVSGTVKATLTGDGSFGSYDRRTIVYPNNRDYDTAYSTSRDVAKNPDP